MASEPIRTRAEFDPNNQRDLTFPPMPDALPFPVADSHCHLDIRDGETWLEITEAIQLAADVGVNRIVQVGVDLQSSYWSVEAAEKFPQLVAAVALHPNEAPRIDADSGRSALDAAIAEISELAKHPRVRGIGETGLDFFRTSSEGLAAQEYSFRRHIQIAKATQKALIIHDRDAHSDVVRVLQDEGAPDKVVFHCFSGDETLAITAAENGWYCSFSGTVTFKNANNLRQALAVLPNELLLVETDAPFLTPTPYRGRPNASYLVPWTVRCMAEVRGMSVQSLCEHISQNTDSVFGSFT